MLERLVANIFSNWANLFVNIVISFFLAPFVVHSLGNTYYGIWVIMMQFTGYLYLLDFGIRESVIRYVSKLNATEDYGELDEVLNSSVFLYSAIGLLTLIVMAVLALAFGSIFEVGPEVLPTARVVVLISGMTICISLAFNVFTGVLMGLQRYDVFNKIGILSAFTRLALIVFFLSRGYGIVALALIQLTIAVAANIIIFVVARRLLRSNGADFRYKHKPIRDRLQIFRSLYNYSIHVVINNLGQKAIYYTDALVIGILLNPASVTFYAIAGNLIEYLRRLILISNNVLNPLVSEMESKDDSQSIHNVLVHGAKLSMLLAIPIAAVYLTMGRQFISHWMGSEYAVLSGDVLCVLAVGVMVSTPQNTISSVLYGISKHNIIARLRIVETVANLALSLVLIHILGIVGVALGTAIPQIVIMAIILPIMTIRVIGSTVGRFVRQAYMLPIAASIPFAVSCYLVNEYLPANSLPEFMGQVLLLGPVHAAGAWFVALSSAERGIFRELLRNRLRTGSEGDT